MKYTEVRMIDSIRKHEEMKAMDMSEKIKSRRTELGMTQEELAGKLAVSRTTVSNWETGRNYPDLQMIAEIADVLGLSLDELLRGDRVMLRRIGDDTKFRKEQSRRIKLLRAALIGILVITAMILFIWLALPRIVDRFYYDPGEIIAEETDADGFVSQTNRMSLDLAVYMELALPEDRRDIVDVDDKGYGKYDIYIPDQFAFDNEGFYDVAGKVERDKLTLYDANAFNRMTGNAFGWHQRRDTKQPLTEQDAWEKKNKEQMGLAEDEALTHGPVDRDYTEEDLNSLEEGKRYNAYVTLNTMMDYEDFFRFCTEDAGLSVCWCAVKVSDVDEFDTSYDPENLGFYAVPNVGMEVNWDEEQYPQLCLSSLVSAETDLRNEEYATAHFTSMLRYMEDNRGFYEMMDSDGVDHDFGAMAEYVEKNGIKVYGLYTMADKESLLELFKKEEVHSIYTTPR